MSKQKPWTVDDIPISFYATITISDKRMTREHLEYVLAEALKEYLRSHDVEVTVYESPHDLWKVEG